MKNKKILIIENKENTIRKDMLDALRCQKSVEEALLNKGLYVENLYIQKKDLKNSYDIKSKILSYNAFCIFNLFEGFSNDPHKEAEFANILEQTNIPFTGNASYTLANCLDKNKTKKILKENNLPTPKWIFFKDFKKFYSGNLQKPLFIKPCFEDASLGIDKHSLVTKIECLNKILEKKIKRFPKGLIIEEFISGKEYNVGFVGEYPYEVLGISVLDYCNFRKLPPFLNYNSKWKTDSTAFKTLLPSVDTKINADLKEYILHISRKAAKSLKCRGYFRVDLRQKEKELFILDINPNPDINRDSGFIRQAYHKGYTYDDIIEKIILIAVERKKLCHS